MNNSETKVKSKKLTAVLLAAAASVLVCGLIAADLYKSDYKTASRSTVAMGTAVSSTLYGGKNSENELTGLTSKLSLLESEISWRIDGSDAARLNSGEAVESETLAKIAEGCIDVYNSSSGSFDITVGAVTTLWDIGGENARVPAEAEISSALERVNGSYLTVSGETVSAGENQFCDFGAVGKGYACDAAKEYLESTDISGAVVAVGGSVLLYGRHNRANDSWRVAVRNPDGAQDDYAGVINLDEGFVSTSGDYERTLEKDGMVYHHIIDPSTGYPADSGLSSVTVIASSGILSDALSTACFVLGLEKSVALLEHYGAQGVFIDHDNNIFVTKELKNSFDLTNDSFTLRDV